MLHIWFRVVLGWGELGLIWLAAEAGRFCKKIVLEGVRGGVTPFRHLRLWPLSWMTVSEPGLGVGWGSVVVFESFSGLRQTLTAPVSALSRDGQPGTRRCVITPSTEVHP